MNYKRLIISLALPQLAGLVGSFFTSSAISSWYVTLQKPSFNPPNWLFGPAWILLYILMGISIYLVWSSYAKDSERQSRNKTRSALIIFWIHLIFNASWSIVFFGFKNPGLALVNIIIIWLLIIILMIKFWKINKWATYLLIPYLLWVSFASMLNYSIWQLN